MTPLAHRIVKELTVPKKARTFNDVGNLLPDMADFHCFELTDVFDAIGELAQKIRDEQQDRGLLSVEQTCFLPAPRTWLEWRRADGEREGVLLIEKQEGDLRFAECVWAYGGQNTFVSAENSGVLALSGFASQVCQDDEFPLPRILTGEPDAARLGWLFWLWSALAVINTPRIIGRRQHMPHRGLERRLAAALKPVGRFPLHAWTEILLRVSAAKDEAGELSNEAHLTGERALHFVRKHLRVVGGRLVEVKAHWRGNGALGIKQSRYKVAA